MNDLLELETRRNIFNIIVKNPGIHLSKIAELLKIRTSLVDYHVNFLEKHELIKSDKETGYKRFYAKGKIAANEKKYLFVLRQKTAIKIILYILKKGRSQHKEILKNLNIAPSSLSYHLRKLVNNDIIEEDKNKRGYIIKNRKVIISILIQYKPYNIYEEFENVWNDLTF